MVYTEKLGQVLEEPVPYAAATTQKPGSKGTATLEVLMDAR